MTTTTYQQFVEKNFRWNFSVNLIDITFITLGWSLVSRETIMPLLVSHLTDSKIAVGMIPAIFSLGFYLPQLLTASYTETLKVKKPFVVLLGGLGERLPLLLVAPALWWFGVSAPGIALIILFGMLGTSAFSAGVATPAWFTMIGKVLPVSKRGIFFGLSESLGAFIGIIGAYFVGQILDLWQYPTNFALVFVLAFTCMAISWGGLTLNREPESPVVKEQTPLWHYLRQLPVVLRRDPNYTHFLLSYGLSKLGAMATGFFLVFGNDSFSLSGPQVATMTATLIGSQAVMNLLWGTIGDRVGHKTVLAGSAFALMLAAAIAWTVTSTGGLIIAFVLLGIGMSADNVSKFNIVLEFAEPEDHPTYIGLTNTLLAPVITIAPLLAGWLVERAGYRPMFATAAILAAAGGLLLALWVREPRHHVREG